MKKISSGLNSSVLAGNIIRKKTGRHYKPSCSISLGRQDSLPAGGEGIIDPDHK